MNTPGADALIQQEAARLAARQAHISNLKSMLTAIPKVNPRVVDTAVDALMRSADEYMAHFPLVDDRGRRSKPGISDARSAVAALQKSLEAAQEKLSDLPLNAFTELTNAYNAPMGRLKADVEQVRAATVEALKTLQSKPDKPPDHARNALAYRVATVLRDIMGIVPTATRDDAANVTRGRGGATYAVVLRATLAVAGVTQVKLGPLIDAGLASLADPDLPENLQ